MRSLWRTTVGGVLTVVVVGALLLAPGPAHAAITNQRISGADRYATAVAVSKAAFPDPAEASAVVVASGETFADALSGGPVAAALGGPLLLTGAGALPAIVAAEISRLRPARVMILGGEAAVSAAVEASLRRLVPDTVRLAGANRFATSISALRATFPEGANRIYVATGYAFPDALSGGALAAAEGAPLLIVPGSRGAAAPEVLELLADWSVSDITVLGGEGAVTAGMAASLAESTRAVSRIAGADRYAVAGQIAARFPRAQGEVLLASGRNYPDALTATVLAARRGAPLLLTRPVCTEQTLRSYAASRPNLVITTVGGIRAVRGYATSFQPCQSTTDPRSSWVLVNKRNPLRPVSYAPSDLRRVSISGGYSMRAEAAAALERMSAAARAAGVGSLGLTSGYRSHATQTVVYGNHVRARGQAGADLVSARPGHSEHQTGLAGDVVACNPNCGSIDAFGSSAAGRWVAANSHRFGFITRYEAGRTSWTGYAPEPWHLRYVGAGLAQDYRASGLRSFEEYLGVPAAPRY